LKGPETGPEMGRNRAPRPMFPSGHATLTLVNNKKSGAGDLARTFSQSRPSVLQPNAG
jgi:hypothetical protein